VLEWSRIESLAQCPVGGAGQPPADRRALVSAFLTKAVLARFGFGSLGLTARDFATPGAMVQLGYPPARIDLLTAIDGVTFAECYPRRQMLAVGGVQLPILSLADFKANKRASGRARDLADLEALEPPGDGN
jgi:hypothetical protein